jgi:arylformamidase
VNSPPRLYDITPPITPAMNVWPGDTPLSRELVLEIEKGHTVTLSAIRSTVHLGAHADGEVHYLAGGRGVGEWGIERFLGPCHLLDAKVERGARVSVDGVAWPAGGSVHPRVLLRTNTFPSFERWNSDFAGLSVELVEELARRGVRTVGVDTPSVDLQDSKDLPAHKAIARADIAILEGLRLEGVPPGPYELIALPLRLMGWDASPVRAVLRSL